MRPDSGSPIWALCPRPVLRISLVTFGYLFAILHWAGNLRFDTVSCSKNNTPAERMWSMPSVPAPADPGRDDDPAWLDRDPMTAAEREAWLDRLCAQDDDPVNDPQEYWDPESCAPPPGQDELTAEELAGVAAAAAEEMLALDAAGTGRRGPLTLRWTAAGRATGSAARLIMSWSGWCAPGTGSRRTPRPASWWRSRR